MKILYVHREFSSALNGGTYVMRRNLEMLTNLFGKDNIICHPIARPSINIIALSLLRLGCYGVSKKEEQSIIDTYCNGRFDYVFLEGSLYGKIVRKLYILGAKTIVFEHNVDALMAYQEFLYDHSFTSLIKCYFIKFNENFSVKYATALIALNKRDCDGFERLYGRRPEMILPITSPKVDLSLVLGLSVVNKPFLLFVGANFYPNIEGAIWFIEHIAPYISLDLRIVGACCENPTLAYKTIPSNVKLDGYVNDLSSYYKSAVAVVAPIFKGSGMKTKVIEAMSYGKSIIGTDEAFQGIECDFSRIGAKCNTAEEFIKAIESLSDNLFNPYTYQVFSDKYETSTVENRLKSFMTTF